MIPSARSVNRSLALLLGALLLLVTACSEEERLDDLNDASYELVDQDSSRLVIPDDLEGQVVLVGYVYTNCPDFCPSITANMRTVRDELGNTDDVRFLTVTFDPERDTPSVLRSYREAFGAEGENWQFVTGEKEEIDAFLERMEVRYEIAEGAEERGEDEYLIDHNDRMSLIDQHGRVVMHYIGSRTPPEYLVEDINDLRESN